MKFSWIGPLQLHLEAAQILQYTEDEFLQTLDWTEGGSNKKKQQLNANSPAGANQSNSPANESMSEGIGGGREDNGSADTDSGEESENEAEEHSEEGEESSSG